jgi:hypothetical protein
MQAAMAKLTGGANRATVTDADAADHGKAALSIEGLGGGLAVPSHAGPTGIGSARELPQLGALKAAPSEK